jgi:hypothetical protein
MAFSTLVLEQLDTISKTNKQCTLDHEFKCKTIKILEKEYGKFFRIEG